MTFQTDTNLFSSRPLLLLEVTLDSGTEYYSHLDIVIGGQQYSGRIMKVGQVYRRRDFLANKHSPAELTIELVNTDLEFSKWQTENLLNREVQMTVYMVTDSPSSKVVFKGLISGISFKEHVCRLAVKDISYKYFKEKWQKFIKQEDWSNAYKTAIGKPFPIAYGVCSNSEGAVPAYLIDTATNKYVCAGHACKAISQVYKNGVAASHTNENLAESFDGDYITTFTVAGAADADEITVNLSGVEDAGDSSGTLLTDPVDCLEHFLEDWAGFPAANIDATTFAAAKVITQARGYVFGSAIVTETAIADVIRDMLLSMVASGWFNSEAVYNVKIFDPELTTASAQEYTEQQNILMNSYEAHLEDAEIFNKLYLRYAYNPATGRYTKDKTIENTMSQTNLDKTYEKSLDLYWIYDDDDADNIARWFILRYMFPQKMVSFRAPIVALNNDLSDLVLLTHHEGIGTPLGSFAKREFEIIELNAGIDSFEIEVVLQDVEAWTQRGRFWFSDNTVEPNSWTSASDSERRLGYLCSRTDGKFSDGQIGKFLA